MMRVKFNKFERVAGIFVGLAFFGFLIFMASVAVKQGWFETKVYYYTVFQNADGVHTGTTVQMAGLKAGSVEDVELLSDNSIHVRFYVLSKFREKIKADSTTQLVRPFIIGERVLEVAVGSEEAKLVAGDGKITSVETVDLMTLMSGKQIGKHLNLVSGMLDNMRVLAEAFFDKNRTQSFIKMFDRIDPLIRNMNVMAQEVVKLAKQANKDEQLGVVLSRVAVTTHELNKLLPQITEQAPHLVKDMSEMVANLSVLTQEFKVVIPALAAIAPDLPRTTRRAVEALDEAVVLIKSMQKSFLMRGSAREVREEELAAEKERNRKKDLESLDADQKRLPAEE